MNVRQLIESMRAEALTAPDPRLESVLQMAADILDRRAELAQCEIGFASVVHQLAHDIESAPQPKQRSLFETP